MKKQIILCDHCCTEKAETCSFALDSEFNGVEREWPVFYIDLCSSCKEKILNSFYVSEQYGQALKKHIDKKFPKTAKKAKNGLAWP